jgi:hypothetical protein
MGNFYYLKTRSFKSPNKSPAGRLNDKDKTEKTQKTQELCLIAQG